VLEPELIRMIPNSGVFGFDHLMELCLEQKVPTHAYSFEGLWLDIGRPEDHEDAAQVFTKHIDRFLPDARPTRTTAHLENITRHAALPGRNGPVHNHRTRSEKAVASMRTVNDLAPDTAEVT
jgi:NDP-sugar pyrophosphorylase family protein